MHFTIIFVAIMALCVALLSPTMAAPIHTRSSEVRSELVRRMQVILLEKVTNLGNLGDIVEVKDGYARNFLIPQKKATVATAKALADFEAKKKKKQKRSLADTILDELD